MYMDLSIAKYENLVQIPQHKCKTQSEIESLVGVISIYQSVHTQCLYSKGSSTCTK